MDRSIVLRSLLARYISSPDVVVEEILPTLRTSFSSEPIEPILKRHLPALGDAELRDIAKAVVSVFLTGVLPPATAAAANNSISKGKQSDDDLDSLITSTKSSKGKPAKKGKTPVNATATSNITSLFAGSHAPSASWLSSTSVDTHVDDARICRFFLAGECLRKDCEFLHTTDVVQCKFFNTPTGCMNGEACKFAHVLDAPAYVDDDDEVMDEDVAWAVHEYHAQQESFEEMFPASLPSASSSAPASRSSLPRETAARRVAEMSLRASFPSLSASLIRSTLAANHNDYGETVRAIMKDYGLEDAMARKHERKSAGVASSSHASTAKAIMRALPWLETGAGVSELYRSHRAQAEAFAKARNELLDKATKAFVSGKRAEATRLSKQGKEMDAEMCRYHKLASSAIFAARNPGYPTIMDTLGHSVLMVDLHGLHSDEAVPIVYDALDIAKASRYPVVWVVCVTGTGHHSHKLGKGGGSVRAALVEELTSSGEEFYEMALDGIPGVSSGVVAVRCSNTGIR